MALVHRSVRLGLLALVVNLIPILGVEAWLVLWGRELTIMNMIALTVAFGIAVDDTLHFLNRLRLARGEPMVGAPEGPAMIQPYLPSIENEGETSLLFFGGRLSHVVNKRPVPGEFRVQVQYGGGYVALPEPPAGALALAEQTLAAIGEDLLYARIDMAPDADGGWLLMEAELIEPDFYLGSAPEGGRRFAEAVRARLPV